MQHVAKHPELIGLLQVDSAACAPMSRAWTGLQPARRAPDGTDHHVGPRGLMGRAMNPSAFPTPVDHSPGAYCMDRGMHLRDYFAAKAMQGFAAEGGFPGLRQQRLPTNGSDAMLRERESSLQQQPPTKGYRDESIPALHKKAPARWPGRR